MIFRSFWVFVLSPIPKNENSEITETHQKPQNTEMWVHNFKNSRNIVQITSKLQWFSYIANHATANWVLKAFNSSEYIKLSPFLFMSVLTQTVKKVVKTQIHMHWSAINQKIKIFHDFRVSVLCPIPKNENSEIPEIYQKTPKYWNVSMQLQKLFKYCSNDINLKMIVIIIISLFKVDKKKRKKYK